MVNKVLIEINVLFENKIIGLCEMNNNKICLVTWYNSINYGTCIQCMALAKYLENYGYDIFVPSSFGFFSLKDPIDFIRRVIFKIRNKFVEFQKIKKRNVLSDCINKGYHEREARLSEVIKNELNIIEVNRNKDFLKLNDNIDVFITGSDQIWNPNFLSASMMLSFVRDDKKKIAYASSIGVSIIPNIYKRTYQRYLSRFNHIGVREEEAKIVLNKILNKNRIEQVLDPTLLVQNSELYIWAQKACIPAWIQEIENYILCYFVGENTQWENIVEEYSNKSGMNVIVCMSESVKVPRNGHVFPGAGPYEFLWLIHNARCVFTDSFHASAISINMNKDFIVYKRFKIDDKKSQNSRINSLLNTFDLQSRLVTEKNSFNKIIENRIKYDDVNIKLKKERFKSEEFLLNAIRKNEDDI